GSRYENRGGSGTLSPAMWPPSFFRHLRDGAAPSAAPMRRVSFRSHVPQIVLIVAMLCALTVVNMAVPYAIKLIVDRVLPGPNHEANWSLTLPILAGIGVAYLLRNGLFFASRM